MRPNLGNSNWSWWAKEKMKKAKESVEEQPKVEDVHLEDSVVIPPDDAQTEILDESETTDDVVESEVEVEVPTNHNKSRHKHKRRNK